MHCPTARSSAFMTDSKPKRSRHMKQLVQCPHCKVVLTIYLLSSTQTSRLQGIAWNMREYCVQLPSSSMPATTGCQEVYESMRFERHLIEEIDEFATNVHHCQYAKRYCRYVRRITWLLVEYCAESITLDNCVCTRPQCLIVTRMRHANSRSLCWH